MEAADEESRAQWETASGTVTVEIKKTCTAKTGR